MCRNKQVNLELESDWFFALTSRCLRKWPNLLNQSLGLKHKTVKTNDKIRRFGVVMTHYLGKCM